jgi:hypothetical protein
MGLTGSSTMAGADPVAVAEAEAAAATQPPPSAMPRAPAAADDGQQRRGGAIALELAKAAAALAAIVGEEGAAAGWEGVDARGRDETDDLERTLTTAAALVEGLRRTLYEVRVQPPLPPSFLNMDRLDRPIEPIHPLDYRHSSLWTAASRVGRYYARFIPHR